MSDPSKIIPLAPEPGGAAGRMPRRLALQTLLGGVGAGFALPSVASAQHPVHAHLASPGDWRRLGTVLAFSLADGPIRYGDGHLNAGSFAVAGAS